MIKWAWILLLPALIVLALVALIPLSRTFYYSFTNAMLDDLDSAVWIGLSNYTDIVSDPQWWRAVWNTVLFTVFSVGIEIVLGLMIALLLIQHIPGRGLLRAAILVPWAIPTVVSSKIWEWLYHHQFGLLNTLFMDLGLIQSPIAFMGNAELALPAIIAVDVWKTTPFAALLLLAGLTTIPEDIYEAGHMDGASKWQRFWYLTLPLLKPALLVTIIFRSLDAMRVFDIIYIMQGSNQQTASMSVYARQQMIDFQEIGMGSAASVKIFLIIGVFTFIYIKTLRQSADY
jgi:trehalose/maltose transport system permease protein